MFKADGFVKVMNTQGNFRFGYITHIQERGSIIIVDFSDEGLSKINWDSEYNENIGYTDSQDFKSLLTETEKKIIPLLAQAKTTKAIAKLMDVAPVTVRAHIRNLKIKLRVDTREQLFAYSQGIMTKIE
jgi:DNA-binding CsgD family transcriptional regulator